MMKYIVRYFQRSNKNTTLATRVWSKGKHSSIAYGNTNFHSDYGSQYGIP